MRFIVYLRFSSGEDKCFLCVCVQNTSVPLSLLGIWQKVGEAELIHTINPGERMTIMLESECLRVESYFGETKFHYIEVPEDDQSVAKTIKCQVLKTAELNKSSFGKLLVRKYFNRTSFQTVSEIKLDLNLESSFVKRSLWTVNSLYDLASLYGYFHSPFRWHQFATLLGFTSKEIYEINETLSQHRYYINDSTVTQSNLITPRRIFCLILSKFQKLGGCLSQVASILYSNSQNKNKFIDNRLQWNQCFNHFEISPFSHHHHDHHHHHHHPHHNQPMSGVCLHNEKSCVSDQIFPSSKLTHNVCYSNPLNPNVNFFNTNHYNQNEAHFTHRNNNNNQFEQSINQSKRKLFRNGSLDRMIHLKKPWSRHARRRNSLPMINQSNESNNMNTLSTFKLIDEFDNFIEFGTPIKRAASYLNLDEEISQITPHKKQCTNTTSTTTNNNINNEILQQKYEPIRKPKILTKRRINKLRQHKLNQMLLPNLWHPTVSLKTTATTTATTTTDQTTQHILNVVHTKLEETKRETEAIHKNVISFLEKIQSPNKTIPNFIESNDKTAETESLFLFSKDNLMIIQETDLWNIIHLSNNNNNNINVPNWKNWLKICHPYYNEYNLIDQKNWSKILSFNKINEHYTSYLILLNWIEINSNPKMNLKPTYANLFNQLIREGYNEFVILCKQKLFNNFSYK
ncbi:unnamed protein product [Schistosoma turkestanicum]|nr:unnamed protein product [Schistosoma turkestanicum]